MKVLLHYEDNDDTELHKSLKITLPKSWKSGPTSKLVGQFVESYNPKFESNQLQEDDLYLAIRKPKESDSTLTELVPLCSDDIVLDVIPDRADVYVCHGKAPTKVEQLADESSNQQQKGQEQNLVTCTRFGCQKRFPKGGPYPTDCQYHELPPVFHETAKYWACCPNKKAYDWDDFQNIPGCKHGTCTEEKKDDGQKLFYGGTDVRAKFNSVDSNLKSIDDFNKAQTAGGTQAAPILERLQNVFVELGMEVELFQQVVEGMKKEIQAQQAVSNDAELLDLVVKELGSKLKASMKSIAAEQLRIK